VWLRVSSPFAHHAAACCVRALKRTIEDAAREPGAGGCDENARASPEPSGVEPVRCPGR
jgi:hypothetical protein